MKINSIEFKNFASYGNQVQTIEFEDQAQLYLTLGKNGHGKTTIANSITVSYTHRTLPTTPYV